MDLKIKKIIAREILLFIGILAFTALVWLILLCRNYYYESKTKSNQEKVSAINSQIDSLPFDRLKVLYEGINKNFIINYKVNDSKYLVPKKHEQEFLKDYPTAKLLPITSKGFSYSSEDVFKEYGGHTLYQLALPKGFIPKDSTTVFDFCTLNKFRDLVKDNEYRNKLYKTFSKEYDLGTKLSFDTKIEIGLKFNGDVIKRQQKLLDEKQMVKTELNSSKTNIKSNDEILIILIWTLAILGIVIYLLRGLILILSWTIKTLKD